jgi:hypothetical protein
MNGTVLHHLPRGFNATMDSPGAPTGLFHVLRQSDQSLIGTAKLLRYGAKWSRFNWVSVPGATKQKRPWPRTRPGDLLRPVTS